MSFRWDRTDVPHKDWWCVSVEDTEELCHTCEMCGNPDVRYVHTMRHSECRFDLYVGCVCAEHMANDYANPREYERLLRNRSKRLQNWMNREWRRSCSGNLYLNIKGQNVGIFRDNVDPSRWVCRIGSKFGQIAHPSEEAAKLSLFNKLYPKRLRISEVTGQ